MSEPSAPPPASDAPQPPSSATPDPPADVPGSTTGDPSVASAGSPPAFTYASPPSRRTTIVRTIVVVGFMVFVFGILLPQFVDYREVLATLQALTPPQVVFVLLLGLVAWILSSSVQAALLPGLGLVHSTESFLAGQAVSNTIPGPVDLAIRYLLYRQWGHAPVPSSLSIVLAGFFDQLAALSLPVVGVVLLALNDERSRPLLLVALMGAIIIAVIFGVGYAMLRSEPFALRVGRLSERIVRAVFKFIRRPQPTGIPERTLALRMDVKDLLLGRGALAYVADLSGRVFYGIVLVISLRLTGVPESALPFSAVIAVYAMVGVALILPIAPGGAGTPQVLYIAWLTTVAGSEWSPQISAGVFLMFVVQWVLPTVIGWVMLWLLRRGRPLLTMGSSPSQSEAPAA